MGAGLRTDHCRINYATEGERERESEREKEDATRDCDSLCPVRMSLHPVYVSGIFDAARVHISE